MQRPYVKTVYETDGTCRAVFVSLSFQSPYIVSLSVPVFVFISLQVIFSFPWERLLPDQHGDRESRAGRTIPSKRPNYLLERYALLQYVCKENALAHFREGYKMAVVKPGLEGVVAGETEICSVRAEEGQLIYRGYDVHDLAEEASFEEVAYLVLFGKLPARNEFDAFDAELKAHRSLPPGFVQTLKLFPTDAVPMDALRTGVSLLALYDPEVEDNSHDANLRKATRLLARVATVVCALHRLSQGLEPVEPDSSLNHAANFLYMLRGDRPGEFEAKVLEVTLILYMEHEFNASTFTGRVIASTLSDLYGAVVGAIAALKGPLHGGANEKAMEVILQIGDPSRAEAWVRETLRQKQRIMGFGHRIYKKADSRVELAKKWGRLLGEKLNDTRFSDICTTVEDVMRKEKNLFPNVDFYAAPIYYMMKVPMGLNTPIFAVSRVVGWSAHVIEQIDHNRLFRPNSKYIGAEGLKFVPLKER